MKKTVMHKRMHPVAVFINKNDEIVLQVPGCCIDTQNVVLAADQAPMVAQWLMEAHAELQRPKD